MERDEPSNFLNNTRLRFIEMLDRPDINYADEKVFRDTFISFIAFSSATQQEEVAKSLQLTRTTIQRWAKEGFCPRRRERVAFVRELRDCLSQISD